MDNKQLNKEKLLLYLESLQATDLETVFETFALAYFLGQNERMRTSTIASVLSVSDISVLAVDIGWVMRQTAAELAALLKAKEVRNDGIRDVEG